MGYIQGINRKQVILFPQAIDDYISEDNPVIRGSLVIKNYELKIKNGRKCTSFP